MIPCDLIWEFSRLRVPRERVFVEAVNAGGEVLTQNCVA